MTLQTPEGSASNTTTKPVDFTKPAELTSDELIQKPPNPLSLAKRLKTLVASYELGNSRLNSENDVLAQSRLRIGDGPFVAVVTPLLVGLNIRYNQLQPVERSQLFAAGLEKWLCSQEMLKKNFPIQLAQEAVLAAENPTQQEIEDAMCDRAARISFGTVSYLTKSLPAVINATDNFRNMFGKTRVPALNVDTTLAPNLDSDYIVVTIQADRESTCFYKVKVRDKSKHPLDPRIIKQRIALAVEDAKEQAAGKRTNTFPYGTMMYLPNSQRAEVYGEVVANPQNKAALEVVQGALFTVSLDLPQSASLGPKNQSSMAAQIRDGNGDFSNNRTPNKALNNIIAYNPTSKEIVAAASLEHSAVDGHESMIILNEVQKLAREAKARMQSPIENVTTTKEDMTLITWDKRVFSSRMMSLLLNQRQEIPNMRDNLVGEIPFRFRDDQSRLADAIAQVAIQMASLQTLGRATSIMFPANVRHLNGRIEFGETLTPEVATLLKSITDKNGAAFRGGLARALESIKERVRAIKAGETFLTALMAANLPIKSDLYTTTETAITHLLPDVARVLLEANVSSNGDCKPEIARFGTAQQQKGDFAIGYGINHETKQLIYDLVISHESEGYSPDRAETFARNLEQSLKILSVLLS